MLEIAAAVPPGSRPVRSQKLLLRAFIRDPELEELHRPRRHHLCEVWRYLVRWAYAGDGTSMPVRSRLCRELGISESTWKRCRRWLEQRGWLGTVRRGWTPLLRASSLAGDSPNEAAIYVLCVPSTAERKTETSPRDRGRHETDPLRRPAPQTDTSRGSSWAPQPRTRPPVKPEVQRCTRALRHGPLKTLSDRWVGWVTRPFRRAGWLPADLAYAVEYHPADGRHRGAVDHVRNPGAWLAWRLSRWLTDADACWAHWREHGRWPAGARPVPSMSARAWHGVKPIGQVYVDRSRAKAARARAGTVLARHRAPADTAASVAAELRAHLGWTRPAPQEGTLMRWIEYPGPRQHQKRDGGRMREGKVWAEGPQPGTIWAVPEDQADRLYVLVHYYPSSPELNYSLESEQQ